MFEPVPQRLRNVRVRAPARPRGARGRRPARAREQARLDGTGRLLVRASGTEPVIRVMVEAEDEGLLADILETVSSGIADLARVACLSGTSRASRSRRLSCASGRCRGVERFLYAHTRGASLPATGPSCLAGCALPLDEVFRVSRERLE